MNIDLTPHALLFIVAAIGISKTAYLIRKRIAAERPVCPIGGGCETVLNSEYNKLLGIHNDILGLIFYTAVCIISAMLTINGSEPFVLFKINLTPFWLPILNFMLFGATAMAAIFIFLQAKVIKAWCFWCLMSAGTILIMDVVAATSKLI